MPEITTEEIDERGRVTVDPDVRELLGIKGRRAKVRLEVDVRQVLDEPGGTYSPDLNAVDRGDRVEVGFHHAGFGRDQLTGEVIDTQLGGGTRAERYDWIKVRPIDPPESVDVPGSTPYPSVKVHADGFAAMEAGAGEFHQIGNQATVTVVDDDAEAGADE